MSTCERNVQKTTGSGKHLRRASCLAGQKLRRNEEFEQDSQAAEMFADSPSAFSDDLGGLPQSR